MKLHDKWVKFFCAIGWHDWQKDYWSYDRTKTCLNCGKEAEISDVEIGLGIWGD